MSDYSRVPMDDGSPELQEAKKKLEAALVDYYRVAGQIPEDAPVLLSGYLLQMEASTFVQTDEEFNVPLVWARGEHQRTTMTLGLLAVLDRNVEIDLVEQSEDDF